MVYFIKYSYNAIFSNFKNYRNLRQSSLSIHGGQTDTYNLTILSIGQQNTLHFDKLGSYTINVDMVRHVVASGQPAGIPMGMDGGSNLYTKKAAGNGAYGVGVGPPMGVDRDKDGRKIKHKKEKAMETEEERLMRLTKDAERTRVRREKEKEGESEESRRNRMKREADRTRQWRQRVRETENDEERKERLMKEALRVRERRKRVRDNENDDERRARLDRDRNRTRKWRDKVRAMETPEARRVRLDMETEKSRHRRAKKKSDTEESEMVTGLVTLAGNSVSDGISSSNYHQHSHVNASNNPDIVLSYPGQSLNQAQAQNTYSTEPAHHQHQHDMPNIYTHSIQHQVIPTSQLLREAADHSSEVMTLITDSQQAYQTNI
jgi:hypothetical protein